MRDELRHSPAEVLEQFVKQTSGKVWDPLGKDDRTAEEDGPTE